MKIDSAIQNFLEKYDAESMDSIDRVSGELGLRASGSTIPVFNIKESFDRFDEYLRGYGQYKIENIENPKASPQETIRENVASFINNHIFECAEIQYPKLPEFVQTYLEGISSLLETIDGVKHDMMVEGVDMEAVGDVNDFTDHFMDKLQEHFDPAMDRILWASGYNAHQRMMHPSNEDKEVSSGPTFL